MLPNRQESAPYFISAGTDRKIRYWTVVKNKKPSFYNISSPVDNESEYRDLYLGDVEVIQEKVTERLTEPVKMNLGNPFAKKQKPTVATKGVAEPINGINELVYQEGKGVKGR